MFSGFCEMDVITITTHVDAATENEYLYTMCTKQTYDHQHYITVLEAGLEAHSQAVTQVIESRIS